MNNNLKRSLEADEVNPPTQASLKQSVLFGGVVNVSLGNGGGLNIPVGFDAERDPAIDSFKTSAENCQNKIKELHLKKISAAIEYEIFKYAYSHLNTEKSVKIVMNIDISYKNVIKDILNKYKFKLISTPDIITQNITCIPLEGYEYISYTSRYSIKAGCITFIIGL